VITRGIPPFETLALSFSVAFVAGMSVVIARGRVALLRQSKRAWAIGFGGIFCYHALYFTALDDAPPAQASLINYLWPLLIVLFSASLPGGSVQRRHLLGAAMGLAGTVLILSGGGLAGHGTALGYGCALAAAFVWAGYSVANRTISTVPSELIAGVCGAVALAAHALDELHGRPLGTHLRPGTLFAAAVVGLTGAVALGVAGIFKIGWPIVPFLAVGPVLVIGYNYEIFGGVIHNYVGFAASWGAYPVLTAYVAQTGRLAWAPVIVAAAAFSLSVAQSALSTPARLLRRRAGQVRGTITLRDGSTIDVDSDVLLAPLELALRSTSWAIMLFAAGLAVARLG